MLRHISVALAVFACLINEFAQGLYSGFTYGTSSVCQVSYPTFSDGFYTAYDGDPSFFITKYQAGLFITLLIFIIAKLIEKETLSQFASFLPLIICVLFCAGISSELNLGSQGSNPFAVLLRETIYYNRLVFSAVSILSLLQIAAVSMSLSKKRKATTLK